MNPRKLSTRPAARREALARCRIAQQYLILSESEPTSTGAAINASIGNAVLAGIAASDALCILGTGVYFAGDDHHGAVTLLERVDQSLAGRLRDLLNMKSTSHYGSALLSNNDRARAVRAARVLVEAAVSRCH